MDIDNNQLKELKIIAINLNIDILILFGSRAKGNATAKSDYDIAFYKNTKYDYDEIYNKIWTILNHHDLNLIDLKEDNSYLLEEEIFKEGIIIHTSSEEIYFERRNQTFINYNDYKQYDYMLKEMI